MDITTVLSESMRDVSISQDEISDIFSSVWQESGLTIIVSLILLILSAIFIVRNMRKSKAKNSIKNEIRGYMKEKYEYSGNVCVVRNGISYSRGNRSVVFDIPIDRVTYLAPWMVDEWFDERNYSAREANIVLADIAEYLRTANLCKTVNIISDEDYEKMLGEEEA